MPLRRTLALARLLFVIATLSPSTAKAAWITTISKVKLIHAYSRSNTILVISKNQPTSPVPQAARLFQALPLTAIVLEIDARY